MHGTHQVLDGTEADGDIQRRQEDGPRAAEDKEGHACLLGGRPPLVLLLEVDEGVDGEAHLGDGEGKDDAEEDGDLPGHAPRTVARFLAIALAALGGLGEVEHGGGLARMVKRCTRVKVCNLLY